MIKLSRHTFIFFLVLCHVFSAKAESCREPYSLLKGPDTQQLLQDLESESVVTGKFSQEKNINILSKPLLAEGQFIFSPNDGLFWHVEKPFQYQLIMTEAFFVLQSNGERELISSSDQPAIFAFGKVFSGILSADFSLVEEYFSLWGKKANSSWMICLEPKKTPFNKLVAKIDITGNKHVDQVEILDLNGDSSRISFSNVSTKKDSLTDNERALFTVH